MERLPRNTVGRSERLVILKGMGMVSTPAPDGYSRNPIPPAGAKVGEWVNDERMFSLPPASVEGINVAIDGSQSRQGFTTSLVSISMENEVVVGGVPVAVAVMLWPAQARQLAGLMLDLADQCDALDATVPLLPE